jgi:hypothetical protein
MYGLVDGNALKVHHLYREQYPMCRLQDRNTFERIHRRLCEHGNFARTPGTGGRPRSATLQEEEDVLNAVDQSPGVSIRQLGLQRYVPHMMIRRLLREHQLYPYHLQGVQALSFADDPARVTFCQWFLQQCIMNPNFTAVVLFTNEATFTRDGIKNLHNQHVWVDINPHATIQSSHQQRFSINIWAGTVGDCLLGPCVELHRFLGRHATSISLTAVLHA